MCGFETFNAMGRIGEIRDPYTNPNSGVTKRGFTITAGKGKSINLELHHWNVKQLEGLITGDQVHVIFMIKGATLKNGIKTNNLVVKKVIKL